MGGIPFQTPSGTFDSIPPQAAARRRLEGRLRSLFEAWGYQEVITPTLELDEVVTAAGGHLSSRHLFRFVDREGQVLVLRPDWTPAVARLISARLKEAPLPLRLFYVGSVFRYDRRRPDDPTEFGQAGVELVGPASEMADAEVMALAYESCRAAGVTAPHLELGHAGYVQALLGLLPEPSRQEARQALVRRDFVAFEAVVGRPGVSGEAARALAGLVESRGNDKALERALQTCPVEGGRRALRSLLRLMQHLRALGLEASVAVDLGMVKDLDYYTGPVFELYAQGGGASLATGGRYDTLMARFGTPLPSTGFAASLDRLLAAPGAGAGQAEERGLDVWVLTAPPGPEPPHAALPDAPAREGGAWAAWELARRLREAGLTAAVDPVERPASESLDAARRRGALWVAAPAGPAGPEAAARVTVWGWPLRSGSFEPTRLALDELVAAVRRTPRPGMAGTPGSSPVSAQVD